MEYSIVDGYMMQRNDIDAMESRRKGGEEEDSIINDKLYKLFFVANLYVCSDGDTLHPY